MSLHLVWFWLWAGLANLSARWWPADVAWQDLLQNPSHHVAWRFFLINAGLVLMALAWGLACFAATLHFTRPQCQQNTITRPYSAPAVLFLSLAAGLALLIALLFCMALGHWLERSIVINLLRVLSLCAVLVLVYTRKSLLRCIRWQPESFLSGFAAVVVVLLLLLYQYASVFPPSMGDGSSFHIPYANFFLQHHGLAVDEQLIYPYHVFNANLLYSLGLMLQYDYSYMQSIHALFVTLTMLGIYVFCREAGQPVWLAIFLAFLYTLLFHSVWARRLANVDAQGAWFVFASVFALWLWLKNRSIILLVFSAVFLGIAFGTKYVLLAFVPPALWCVFYFERSWVGRSAFLLCLFVAGSWWYIRNLWLTGNPVHPFAPEVFGYDAWDAFDMRMQLEGALHVIPREFPGLLLMPWLARANPILNEQGAFFILAVLYVCTATCWLVHNRLNILLGFSWVYVLSWIWASQDPRHLIPIFPLVFVHAGAIIHRVYQLTEAWILSYASRWLPSRIVQGAHMLVLTVFFVTAVAFAMQSVRKDFFNITQAPIAPGPAREAYMHLDPRFRYFAAVNQNFTADETLFEFGARDGRWFLKPHVVGNQFGPHGYAQVYRRVVKADGSGMDPGKLETLLRQQYGAAGFIIPRPPGQYFDEVEFDRHFELCFRSEVGSVYRLRP